MRELYTVILKSLLYSDALTMDKSGQIYGISKMAVSKRLKKQRSPVIRRSFSVFYLSGLQTRSVPSYCCGEFTALSSVSESPCRNRQGNFAYRRSFSLSAPVFPQHSESIGAQAPPWGPVIRVKYIRLRAIAAQCLHKTRGRASKPGLLFCIRFSQCSSWSTNCRAVRPERLPLRTCQVAAAARSCSGGRSVPAFSESAETICWYSSKVGAG